LNTVNHPKPYPQNGSGIHEDTWHTRQNTCHDSGGILGKILAMTAAACSNTISPQVTSDKAGSFSRLQCGRDLTMTEKLHICAVCAFEYEQTVAAQSDFHELSENWECPSCGIHKDMFHHYSCDQMVAEMTGMLAPNQPFSTVGLPHLEEF